MPSLDSEAPPKTGGACVFASAYAMRLYIGPRGCAARHVMTTQTGGGLIGPLSSRPVTSRIHERGATCCSARCASRQGAGGAAAARCLACLLGGARSSPGGPRKLLQDTLGAVRGHCSLPYMRAAVTTAVPCKSSGPPHPDVHLPPHHVLAPRCLDASVFGRHRRVVPSQPSVVLALHKVHRGGPCHAAVDRHPRSRHGLELPPANAPTELGELLVRPTLELRGVAEAPRLQLVHDD
mmetsp:Transcript_29322/g.81895  ORF Transcript_29322/g.81895 Transcript_29322/m.81895 type:complete len:237 (-) Transcript_29322:565-1275(-)